VLSGWEADGGVRGALVVPASDGAKIVDQCADALAHALLLEQSLSDVGILDELLRNSIGHDLRFWSTVEDLPDLGNKFVRQAEKNGFNGFAKAPSSLADNRFFERSGFDGSDAGIGKGFFSQPLDEADPAEPMK
tara:strand:- start:1062 stop:1463 length:402 start_codon:yes stop_codon:yes gene_type:complete